MNDIQRIRNALHAKKFFTIVQLAFWLNVSIPTARRRLQQWHAYTSYNNNGRYYTLPDIPQFDQHGLWRHQGVFFSQHGSLVRTVVHLVRGSDAGYTGEELGALLGLQPRSFLAPFRRRPELSREKLGGRFIWFAADEQIRQQQKQLRLHRLDSGQELPSDPDAVVVLAELIRYPESSAAAMARRLSARGVSVTATQIENLLRRHNLLKKTAGSPSS